MIPAQQELFQRMITKLFPKTEFSKVIVRTIHPPEGPAITVLCMADLIGSADLERLVLTPLAQGGVSGPPSALIRSGRFPAANLSTAAEGQALIGGLLAGLAAVHVDGHPGVLLVGSSQPDMPENQFGPSLESRITTLSRQLRRLDLQTERHARADGTRVVIMYLKSTAAPATVQSVRTWALNVSAYSGPIPWWQTLLNVFRLPPAVESAPPSAVAASLRRGYVAVLRDDQPEPLVAPTTLELLFQARGDSALPPAVKKVIFWPRLVAAVLGLTLNASLVAVSAYHHSLMPGPFLVAMATTRGNLPLPVVGEMLLVSVISDSLESAVVRTGGRKLLVLAQVGSLLAFMTLMQVGMLGAISGAVGIVDNAIRATLPNPATKRAVRLWRYFFIGAGAGLGMTGMTLLFFLLMIYVAEEQALGHPIRLPPAEVPL